MKAYMAYCCSDGPEQGAVLVFAHTQREARRISYPVLSNFTCAEWIDTTATLIKDSAYLFTCADQKKLVEDVPHVIDNPPSCVRCERWGTGPLDASGVCEECREVDEMYDDPDLNVTRNQKLPEEK